MTIIFFILGVIFASIGIFIIIDHKNFLKIARKANGKVIALEKYISTTTVNDNTENGTFYRPVIDFTVNNDNYRLTASIGSGTITHEIGQRISLLYLPDNPKDARMDTHMHYIMGAIFTVIGLGSCSVYIFANINTGFVWWDGLIAIFFIGFLFIKARKFMKNEGIKSIDEIKREFKKTQKDQGSAVIIGSEDDPFLDNTRIFYKNRKEFMAEKGKLEAIGKIINLIFMVAGCSMVYFGWSLYKEEILKPEPDMVKQYALLGMGGLFALASLLNLLKSNLNVKRV